MTANTPGGGTVTLDGQAGPIDSSDAANTPFQATAAIAHLDVKSTGFIDPASGLSGVVDFTGSLVSDGQQLTSKGQVRATGVQLVPGGTPARVPIEIDYESDSSRKAQTGVVKGDVHIGKAVAHLTGDYNGAGEAIAVRMKLSGEQHAGARSRSDAARDWHEAAVRRVVEAGHDGREPHGRRTSGSPRDRRSGPRVQRPGRRFRSRRQVGCAAIARRSVRRAKTGDTLVQTLAATLRVAPDGIQAASLNLVAPAIGSLTGSGTISAKGDVDFAMRAKLTSSGVVGEVSRVVSLSSARERHPVPHQGHHGESHLRARCRPCGRRSRREPGRGGEGGSARWAGCSA